MVCLGLGALIQTGESAEEQKRPQRTLGPGRQWGSCLPPKQVLSNAKN